MNCKLRAICHGNYSTKTHAAINHDLGQNLQSDASKRNILNKVRLLCHTF